MNNLININSSYIQKKSPFSEFKLRSNQSVDSTFWSPTVNTLAAEEQNKNEGNSQFKKIAKAIVISAGFVILTRTVQKRIAANLDKLKDLIQHHLDLSAPDGTSKLTRFYEIALRGTNNFIEKAEILNNITSLKDILFMNLMYKTAPTKKIHQYCTEFFNNLSRKSVIKSYQKTGKNFDQMLKTFDRLDEYILKNDANEIVKFKGKEYTKKELVQKAKEYRETAKLSVENFMSQNAQDNRYQYIKEVNASLYSKFWDIAFKDFWSKESKVKRNEMWRTFIAAEQIKGDKTLLAENVAIARNVISYTDGDKAAQIHKYIKNLDKIISFSDTEGLNILKKLEWFIKTPENLNTNKEIFLKELEKLNKYEFKNSNLSKELVEKQQEYKSSCINLIKELALDETTGEIQDMLAIYRKIAPFELAKFGADKSVKNAVKSFDKSVNLEIVEYFDKVRDLELGSAPTDVLTILVSLALIMRSLQSAKNDEQKISVMCKEGIPLAGGVGTSVLSATKLISGGKSILLGIVSGLALNKLGLIVEKLRKQPPNKK